MNAQIVCRLKGAKLTFKVGEKEAVVGRDPGLAVAVPADGVSRQHAKISWDGGSYWIEDLKSTNGTFVNGLDVAREGKERLRHLDVITLGRAIDLLFLVRDAAPSAVTRRGVVRAALVPEDGETPPYEIGVGEVSLGRSTVNNLVIESSAVSKQHAKVLRTTDSVVLQDLGSANGTFVNNARVMTALLQDGDRVSLAGVASYRVQVQMGEVTSLPEARGTAPKMAAAPELSADWKTRFEWSSGEFASIEALRKKLREAEGATTPLEVVKSSSKPAAAAAPAAKAAAKPAAAPPEKPAEKPAAPPKPAEKAPAAPAAAKPPAPAVVKPPTPVAPKPEPPVSVPAKAAPAATPAPPRLIAKVQLQGGGVDLAVTQPGSYEMGRLSGSALRIPHPTISRRQAVLTLAPDRTTVRLEPVAGASPTLVNGQAIDKAVVLANGDTVQFGEVPLTVRIES